VIGGTIRQPWGRDGCTCARLAQTRMRAQPTGEVPPGLGRVGGGCRTAMTVSTGCPSAAQGPRHPLWSLRPPFRPACPKLRPHAPFGEIWMLDVFGMGEEIWVHCPRVSAGHTHRCSAVPPELAARRLKMECFEGIVSREVLLFAHQHGHSTATSWGTPSTLLHRHHDTTRTPRCRLLAPLAIGEIRWRPLCCKPEHNLFFTVRMKPKK